MQRFLKWLGKKLFPKKPNPKLRQTGIRAKPKLPPRREQENFQQAADVRNEEVIDFDADVPGRIEDGGPGKNVFVRNKYVREDTGTHEKLKIINDSLVNSDEEDAFDPYNTGRYDRSKNWNSRSSK